MSGILIYSEVEETALGLLTIGKSLSTKLDKALSVALLGNETPDQVETYFSHGAIHAYIGSDSALTHFQASVYAEALAQVVTLVKADIILIGSTRRGRELAPRLAQKLSAGCVTDAVHLSLQDQHLVIERRAFGGNTVSTRVIKSPQQIITVMPKIYNAEPGDICEGEIIPVSLDLVPSSTRVLELRPKKAGGANIEDAEVLICIGRGLNNKEDLALIQTLADTHGGMIGCTRPISHDLHWLTEDQMVGLSGKEVSPRLCVAIGISGQIQHTVGMMNAEMIVSINKDANAPIFGISDYGIIGDLYEVVPMLIERIQHDL